MTRRGSFLFERAYTDYAAHLGTVYQWLHALVITIWTWLWIGRGSRLIGRFIRLCVPVTGIGAGITYVAHEQIHGRGVSVATVLAFAFIVAIVWSVAWGWKGPVQVLSRAAAAVSASVSVALTASVTIALAFTTFVLYLVVIALGTAFSFLVFLPMRGLHTIWLIRRRIRYVCPYSDCNCRGMPVHACSHGHRYKDLQPSFLGVFHHYCTHGGERERLPTMDFLGRNKLTRYCPGCGRLIEFGSYGLMEVASVLLAGGPDASKSVYSLTAVDALIHRLNGSPENTVTIDSDKHRDHFEQAIDSLAHGRLPPKTIADVVAALGVALRLTTPRRLERLMYLFDPPGEFYDNLQGRGHMLRKTQGIILVVDPWTTRLRKVLGEPDPRLKPSASRLSDTVAQVLTVLETQKRRRADSHGKIRVAVVLSKTDGLPDDIPSFAVLKPSAAGKPSRSACRQALDELGERNSMKLLEDHFGEVEYFACSALGRMPDPSDRRPFEPVGVIDPLLWVLGLDSPVKDVSARRPDRPGKPVPATRRRRIQSPPPRR